jgi:glycosyltransferase involved in cell wall biosynthesis
MGIELYKDFTPLVSVVLPTYNRADYILRAVNSVINQNYKEWELIIVDDGSTDNTAKIVDNLILERENIRFMKQKNRGTALAFNTGIQASTGQFITFLGSDDEYKPDHLELRVKFLHKNPEIDFLHGGLEIIGHSYVKDKDDLSKEIHISECAVGGTFFGKRIVFFEGGGFKNLGYAEDSEFLERIQNKFNVKKIDLPTYKYYRDTPDSICTNIKEIK